MHDRPTEALLSEYARTRDAQLRSALIERHEGLVRAIAHKFARPGAPLEDLVQVGWVALIGALDRYNPAHGTKFSTYAVSCMAGEIKRYFRDRTWGLRVPRDLQDLAARLEKVEEELHRELGRGPTVAEMAAACGVPEEQLLQAMELGHAYQPLGLDEIRRNDEGTEMQTLGETVGSLDPGLERILTAAPLEEAIATLDERLQRLVRLRFFQELSQSETARELGLSQMHVSRLERRALEALRATLRRSAG